MLRGRRRHTGFRAFIIAGIVLAVALLAQTVWTYVFVSRDLVRREARRQAARDVTALDGRSLLPAFETQRLSVAWY